MLLCQSRPHAAASTRRLATQGTAAIILVTDAPAPDVPCPVGPGQWF